MAYKSNRQKEAEAEAEAADERTAPVLESEAFKKEMLRYKPAFNNIPMLLKAILEERVATRLLLEGKV